MQYDSHVTPPANLLKVFVLYETVSISYAYLTNLITINLLNLLTIKLLLH